MCKTEKETYKSFRTLLEMRNWGNMSTTAHGTPQSRWRCEENLFEGTGTFSFTVRLRPGPPLARAPGKRYPLLSQVESLLLLSSSACQEQALGRDKEPRAGAAENGSQSCPWAVLGGDTSRHIPDSWSWKLSCVLLYRNSYFTRLK